MFLDDPLLFSVFGLREFQRIPRFVIVDVCVFLKKKSKEEM